MSPLFKSPASTPLFLASLLSSLLLQASSGNFFLVFKVLPSVFQIAFFSVMAVPRKQMKINSLNKNLEPHGEVLVGKAVAVQAH